MKNSINKLIVSIIILSALLFGACGEINKEISYSWGETLNGMIQKLNEKNIKYFLQEDDKSAFLKVKVSDIGADEFFEEKIFYFVNSLIIEEESVEFDEPRLILVADSVVSEEIDKEMAKKEIVKLSEKYGEPDEEPENEEEISGFTWNEKNEIISTEYYSEHGLFRVSTRLNTEERKKIKNIEEKKVELSSGENIEYKWGESSEDLIRKLQKENTKYYIGEEANVEVINIVLGGESIFDATTARGFYFSDTFIINDEEVSFNEKRLFIVTESTYLSKEELPNKIKGLTEKYGKLTNKPDNPGDYTGYAWETEDSIISTVYIEEYNAFTLSFRFKDNDKADFMKYKIEK